MGRERESKQPSRHLARSDAPERDSEQARDDAASERDGSAHARDLAALARDQLAELRDRKLAARDAGQAQQAYRTAEARRLAALRDEAAEQRARAAADREHAARDREAAARDRLRAAADRAAAREPRPSARAGPPAADPLTELQAEIDRAHRSGGRLVVAYLDVVAMRELGEAERDRALDRVAGVIRRHLRSYDRIVRLDGEVFLCAIPDVEVTVARRRFAAITHELAGDAHEEPIEADFVAVGPEDSAAALVRRVDAQFGGRRR